MSFWHAIQIAQSAVQGSRDYTSHRGRFSSSNSYESRDSSGRRCRRLSSQPRRWTKRLQITEQRLHIMALLQQTQQQTQRMLRQNQQPASNAPLRIICRGAIWAGTSPVADSLGPAQAVPPQPAVSPRPTATTVEVNKKTKWAACSLDVA